MLPISEDMNAPVSGLPGKEMVMKVERRWIILAEDGRHVTVGRHTDPTPDQIDEAGRQLSELSIGGWLAVMEGGYYRPRDTLKFLIVREIASTNGITWDEAVTSFKRIRERALSAA